MDFDRPLSEVETEDFGGLMPVGEYLGVITEAEEQVSKAGNEMLKIEVTLQGNALYNRRKFWYYLVNNSATEENKKRSLEQAKKLMAALRVDVTGLKSITRQTVLGLPCKIKIKHEWDEYRGGEAERIHYFTALTEDEEAAALSGESGRSKDPAPPDDIPF